MIGIDTHVLLRLVVRDDPAQGQAAARLLTEVEARGEPVRVALITLAEAAWVLQRRYRYSRTALREAISLILAANPLLVEHADLVEHALRVHEQSKADFADILIGLLNRQAGCRTTYSFDRAATGLDTFTAVLAA
jgi:predicted nucleic-acid-binding protein